jgi:alpha-L-rhamnosidase
MPEKSGSVKPLPISLYTAPLREATGVNMNGESIFVKSKAEWIWPADLAGTNKPQDGATGFPAIAAGAAAGNPITSPAGVNQYVEFRQEFDLPVASRGATLTICVDSNYVAWLNGQFVGTGQFSNYPDRRTYDVLPAGTAPRKGRNVLAILVRFNGQGFHSYIPGAPGAIWTLRAGKSIVASGRGALWRSSPCYRQGLVPKITRQLGFTWQYDASADDEWRRLEYAPGADWSPIGPSDLAGPVALGTLIPRPIERLRIGGRTEAIVAAQGVFRRQPPPGSEDKTLAWLMQRDWLSARTDGDVLGVSPRYNLRLTGGHEIKPVWRDGDGVYLVIDLGREEAGCLELDLETDSGVVVDMAYGEHLEDLRVRAEIFGRNFADRYICKAGRQQYTHWLDRWAGRYLQLHIHGLKDRLAIHYVGLRTTEYPLERRGEFRTCDELANRIHEAGVRTLQLCLHERYEDCPWREQALYENDARNQALCGYYCFGEYSVPRTALDMLGRGLHDDGFLEMTAPSNLFRTIPSFSMVWILAMEDYYLHTGDAECIRAQIPTAEKMLAGWLASRVDGLMPSPQGKRFWHFYDWADGLDGDEDYPGMSWVLTHQRFDAPLNLYLCLALGAADRLLQAVGEPKRAWQCRSASRELRASIHRRFFDARAGAYRTYAGKAPGPCADLTQALAILAKTAPAPIERRLRAQLAAGGDGWVQTTLSQSIYKFQAIMTDRRRHGPAVFEMIRRDWGGMLFRGATSLWEVNEGPRGGSSLCHGWSAIPVFFYQACLLGVQPLTPGFAEFSVDPVISAAPCAEGVVPTPRGPIRLRWERQGPRVVYDLSHPGGLVPRFPSLRKGDVVRARKT